MTNSKKARKLDELDVAILEALQEDASLTNQAIGDMIGLTPGPTHSRIKRLKEEGIIRGFHADLDWTGLGYGFFATVDVKVPTDDAGEAESWLARIPNVWNLCRIKHPNNQKEAFFRFWSVSDSRDTLLTIAQSLLEQHDCFTDVQIQEVELIERKSEVVKVGRVALGKDQVPVWSPLDADSSASA